MFVGPYSSFYIVPELVVEGDIASVFLGSADGFRNGPYFGLGCAGGNERKGVGTAADAYFIAGTHHGEQRGKVAGGFGF